MSSPARHSPFPKKTIDQHFPGPGGEVFIVTAAPGQIWSDSGQTKANERFACSSFSVSHVLTSFASPQSHQTNFVTLIYVQEIGLAFHNINSSLLRRSEIRISGRRNFHHLVSPVLLINVEIFFFFLKEINSFFLLLTSTSPRELSRLRKWGSGVVRRFLSFFFFKKILFFTIIFK